jgi:hypothetical protein
MEDAGAVRPRPQVCSVRGQRSTIWLRRVLIALAMAVLVLIGLIAVQPVVVVVVAHGTSGGVAYLTDGSSAIIPHGSSLRIILSAGGGQRNGIRFLCADLPLSEIRGTGYLGGDYLFDFTTADISGCNLALSHRLSLP